MAARRAVAARLTDSGTLGQGGWAVGPGRPGDAAGECDGQRWPEPPKEQPPPESLRPRDRSRRDRQSGKCRGRMGPATEGVSGACLVEGVP